MFKYEGLIYEVTITPGGVISFGAVHGSNARGTLELTPQYEEYSVMTDVNLITNPMGLFRKVGDIVVDWVYKTHPHTFSFTSTTDRKNKVYQFLAEKLLKKVPDYNLVEYPTGTFRFYRKQND